MKKLKILAPALITGALVCLPLLSLAQANVNPSGYQTGRNVNPSGYPAGTNVNPSGYPAGTPSGSPGAFSVPNPLAKDNFCDLIKLILQAIMVIGLPIAVLFLVYVGFKFITAQGNPEKIKQAQRNLLNTVIGIGIFLGAWTIAQIITNTLRQLGVTGAGSC